MKSTQFMLRGLKQLLWMGVDAQSFLPKTLSQDRTMKAEPFKRLFLLLILILGSFRISFAAGCDQTLGPGANVRSAIASAAGGSNVCLNAGSYGNVTIDNIVKPSEVTVQSTSGNTATIKLIVLRSERLKFQNLTISGMEIHNQAKNITVSGSTFKGQLLMNLGGNGGSNYGNANILIDGNSFDNISVCSNCYEGRVQIISSLPSGVTISNNHFGGPGESDGIQNSANGVVIGPGNVFDGIKQGSYGRHVDTIQGYGQSHTTITGNYFVNNDIQIMMPDGGNTEIITNNVFIASPGNNGIQLGTHTNDSFIHNTVKNITVNMDKKVENSTPSKNVAARNNVMISSEFKTLDSGGNAACSNCTFEHNLFNSSGNAKGVNNIIGTPTFIGGTSPTTWAGHHLTSSSPGYQAATDGEDMGSNSFGPGTPPPVAVLAAPTNLRVN